MKEGKFQNAMKQFAAAIQRPTIIPSLIGVFIMAGAVLSFDFMPAPVRLAGRLITRVFLEGGMQQLSLFFCIAVTCALVKRNKTEAALLAAVSFLLFVYASHCWLEFRGLLAEPQTDIGLLGSGQGMFLGLQTVDMGVFAGIILACFNAFFLNRFSDTEGEGFLSGHGSLTLACVLDLLSVLTFSVAVCFVWPICSRSILWFADFLSSKGNFSLFIYNFLQRFLISTGLHHLVYLPFYYSQLGGTLVLDGTAYSGANVIWYAEVANAGKISALHDSVRYLTCGFAQVCGFIGASLAFLTTAEKEKKKGVRTMLLPMAGLVLLKGITEPFEFTFMFTAPLLWFVHSILDGLSQVFLYAMGSRLPMDGGLIDAVLNALLLPGMLTHWPIMAACAIPVILVWYLVFVLLIRKLQLNTPGRSVYTMRKKSLSKETDDTDLLIAALGGADNIEELTNCATRLRIVVKDPSKIKENLIDQTRNSGIVRKGNNIQIIIGTAVGDLKNKIAEKLGISQ